MSCILNSGYQVGCSQVGGIEKVWIATYDADTTYSFDADNMVIGSTGAINPLYLMEQDVASAGLTQPGVISRENNTVYYDTVLSLKFNSGLTKELRNLMLALGNAPLMAVVKSNEGLYYILGVELPGRSTATNLDLGVAMGDMNGGTVEITFSSKSGAFLLDETILGTELPVAANP